MQENQPPAQPGSSDIADAGDIQALLDQAESLAQTAATEVGAAPLPERNDPVDLERPPIGSTPLDDQMDEVSALVEQAGRDAGTIEPSAVLPAAEATKPDEATPATVVENADDVLSKIIDETAHTQPAAEAVEAAVQSAVLIEAPPAAEPVQQAEAVAAVTALAEAVAAPASETVDPVADAAPVPEKRGSSAVLRLMMLPLTVLNRPFARASDSSRTIAGLIGLLTLLSGVALWMLPHWMKPTHQ